MMLLHRLSFVAALTALTAASISSAAQAQTVDLRTKYAATLLELSGALRDRQIVDPDQPGCGAIQCVRCGVLHTRAAEALYPFAVCARITGDRAYARAAILAGNWLIRQQQEDGSWKETPEEWTGTTTDQLLMMALAFPLLQSRLTPSERERWRASIEGAAGYLCRVMRPEFASINYVATSAAALVAVHALLPGEQFLHRARDLARRTVSKMDPDGFIDGEGGRGHGVKLGVDLGYDMEMSLWGLGYYARITGDTAVTGAVRHALDNHLYFIYPDGSMDGSWGIRSNKWTTYGGVTSDGCQVLFSLFSDKDPRYVTAAWKNLEFLRGNMRGGLVGYGPHYWTLFSAPPCIYPTFTKAKNLALAYELERAGELAAAPLPTDGTPLLKVFRTLDVCLVRTASFMATITSYGYKDQAGRAKSKYMYRPSGGAVSNLWVPGHGFLQASSATIYSRPEPMTFPEAPGIRSLTPRIEFSDSTGYFTNLFEFDGRMEARADTGQPGRFTVSAEGELNDREWLPGGVGYRLRYRFADSSLEKRVVLRYHDARPVISIVEPVIDYPGMTFEQRDARTVLITSGGRRFELKILDGDADVVTGRDRDRYWAPFPALKAFPIELVVRPPSDGFERSVTYRFSLLRPE